VDQSHPTLRKLKRTTLSLGSGFDDWVYWTLLLQLQLIVTAHTLNSFMPYEEPL
jgi:hypothetical protein